MNKGEDDIHRHAAELVRLTMSAYNREKPLPEDELARLGEVIAMERQLLIDAMSSFLHDNEPEAATQPGVAEFDAGFRYGLEFARAVDEAKVAIDRVRRGQMLKIVKG